MSLRTLCAVGHGDGDDGRGSFLSEMLDVQLGDLVGGGVAEEFAEAFYVFFCVGADCGLESLIVGVGGL